MSEALDFGNSFCIFEKIFLRLLSLPEVVLFFPKQMSASP